MRLSRVGVPEHLQGTVVLVFAGLLVKISLLLKFWQGQDDIKIFCFTFLSDELHCTYKMHVIGTLPLSYKPSLKLLPLQTMQSLENDLKRKTAIFTYTCLLRAHVLCYNCISLGLSVNKITNIFYLVRANSTVVMLSLKYT